MLFLPSQIKCLSLLILKFLFTSTLLLSFLSLYCTVLHTLHYSTLYSSLHSTLFYTILYSTLLYCSLWRRSRFTFKHETRLVDKRMSIAHIRGTSSEVTHLNTQDLWTWLQSSPLTYSIFLSTTFHNFPLFMSAQIDERTSVPIL
jgi:hypothetical protein